jgi:hypothetical protein
MALTFTPRTGVAIMHGSSLANTLRALRLLEMSTDLDLDIVVGVRMGDPDESALAAGLRGRGALLPVDPPVSDSAGWDTALAGMVGKGNQYAWIISPDLVIGKRTLRFLTKHMTVVPDCAVVSPRIMQSAQPRAPIWSDGGAVSPDGAVTRLSAGLRRKRAPRARAVDVDAVHRVGSLYRVSAMEAVGLFADGDEVDGHDVGWSNRVRSNGWRVMVQRRAEAVLEGADDA